MISLSCSESLVDDQISRRLSKYPVMSNNRKPQWSNIRKRLLLLGHKELIAQIKDLYAISDENRRFLESRFAQGQDQIAAVLADYKQEIFYCFFGERGISDDLPRLRDARRLIRDYRKATQDSVGHPGSDAALCGDRHRIHQHLRRYQ